uniref:Transmembrane protein 120 homolog n=1 Tax=Macrostomum lignano TaxID=282301 RepID=A0A1I8IKX7_9PLAT
MSFLAYNDYQSCEAALDKLNEEFQTLKKDHELYTEKVDEMKKMQTKCLDGIKHQRYRAKQILNSLTSLERVAQGDEKDKVEKLMKRLAQRKALFADLEDTLPHKNGLYLNIVLGQVNVSLLSKVDKFAYKQDYEAFKLVLTLIILVAAIFLFLFLEHRVFDAAFQFLLVWYYCTLTIRESILIVNGSRIKGWWVAHHFVSVVCSGIVLTWPREVSYYRFRNQFNLFCVWCSTITSAAAYGFMSWMWRRLGFVLPFLFLGYGFQLYNSFVLFKLFYEPDCQEWQVIALSGLFLLLFLGNTTTTFGVVKQKMKSEGYSLREKLKRKYRFSVMSAYGRSSTSSDSPSGTASNAAATAASDTDNLASSDEHDKTN